MVALNKIVVIAAFVTQVGCGSTPASTGMVSAVLIQPLPVTTQVLNKAVSQALNGAKVSLARNVLIGTSELQIERMAQGSASMSGMNGTLLEMPKIYRFSLKKSSRGGCFLLYPKTGNEYRLKGVQCKVL